MTDPVWTGQVACIAYAAGMFTGAALERFILSPWRKRRQHPTSRSGQNMVATFIYNRLPQKIRETWPINRVINDLLIILVVILGWLVVDYRGDVADTQNCFRQYEIDKSHAQQPRNDANEETDEALAEALSSFRPLLSIIIENNKDKTPTPEDQQKGLAAVIRSNDALNKFAMRYSELEEARKKFPISPAPEDLCKE